MTFHPACQGLELVPSPNLLKTVKRKPLGPALQFFLLSICFCMAGMAHRYQGGCEETKGFCLPNWLPGGIERRKGTVIGVKPGLSRISVFFRLCDHGQATPPLWVSTFPSVGCEQYLSQGFDGTKCCKERGQ